MINKIIGSTYKIGNKIYRNLEAQVLENQKKSEANQKEIESIKETGVGGIISPSFGENSGAMKNTIGAYGPNSLAVNELTAAGINVLSKPMREVQFQVIPAETGYNIKFTNPSDAIYILPVRIFCNGYGEYNWINIAGEYDNEKGYNIPDLTAENVENIEYLDYFSYVPTFYYVTDLTAVSDSGSNSAEGYYSIASGEYAHAEGGNTSAIGPRSHAEGSLTYAIGFGSHAEGVHTNAIAEFTHTEGRETIAEAAYAHAEGNGSRAAGSAAHAEGANTNATGVTSHAEGADTRALAWGSHAEGLGTTMTTNATAAHVEGWKTEVRAPYAHAEGYETLVDSIATYSHAEGYRTKATNTASHAEGFSTTASGIYSHAEGDSTTASGSGSHAEGLANTASGIGSHAEGQNNKVSGNRSHVEGLACQANGDYSHIGGNESQGSQVGSFLHGWQLRDSRWYQTVVGLWNEVPSVDKGEQFIVGCGNSTARANAFVAGNNTTDGKYIQIGNTKITESQLQSLLALLN